MNQKTSNLSFKKKQVNDIKDVNCVSRDRNVKVPPLHVTQKYP
jgi:hypothetical protein